MPGVKSVLLRVRILLYWGVGQTLTSGEAEKRAREQQGSDVNDLVIDCVAAR